MNLDELFQLPLLRDHTPQVLVNIVYVIEGDVRLDSGIEDQQSQRLRQGDALISSNEGLNLGASRYTIISNVAKIYHGVIAIPQ
jgi:hypothetical protein